MKTFCFIAEVPKKGRKPALIIAPIEARSEARAFDRLWLQFPHAIAISLKPLKVSFGFGRGIAV